MEYLVNKNYLTFDMAENMRLGKVKDYFLLLYNNNNNIIVIKLLKTKIFC